MADLEHRSLSDLEVQGVSCLADALMRMTSVREQADALVLDDITFAIHRLMRRDPLSSFLVEGPAVAFAMNSKERAERFIARNALTPRVRGEIARKLQELDELLMAAPPAPASESSAGSRSRR